MPCSEDSGGVTSDVARLSGRIDRVERSLGDLEASIDLRMGRMESVLDNISRESARTNVLLETLVEQARREQDRQDRREEAHRTLLSGAAGEVWGTVRGPLGYLIAAFATYVAFQGLERPDDRALPPRPEPPSFVLPRDESNP